MRLKRIVELRTERADGNAGDENYLGLERIESWTGRLIEPTADVTTDENDLSTNSTVSSFREGDVLFSKLRPYLAKAHFAKDSGVCTTELLVMQPKEELLDGKFLLYAILSQGFIERVNTETFGARMPRANWETVGNQFVSLPPLSKQHSIADYLDRKTAVIDDLLAEKQRLLEVLAEKRQSLITQAVTRGLDGGVPLRDSGIDIWGTIPVHWAIVHLRRVLNSMDYGISESVGIEGDVAVLRMGDVYEGEISLLDVGFVSEVDSHLLLKPGDLLFNRTKNVFVAYEKHPVRLK